MRLTPFNAAIVDQAGNILPGASVTVYLFGTSTPAALFSDSAGQQALTNPFFVGPDALAQFYADQGRYTIVSEDNPQTGQVTWYVDLVFANGVPFVREYFTATAGQSTFTALTQMFPSEGTELVSVGGVEQKSPENYSFVYPTITFTEGLEVGTVVSLMVLQELGMDELARQWATKPDTPVLNDEYSAYYWAQRIVNPLTSIDATPLYLGQFAVVSSIGYMAVGTSTPADWLPIT